MTEQQDQADAAPGVEGRPKQSLRTILRVAEIRARSTPQLLATVGVMAALTIGSFWSTIALVRAGGPLDWRLPAALLVDVTVLVCLPGVIIACVEVLRRIRRLLTADDDGPLLTRSARAAARFTAQARADLNRSFDSLNTPRLLSLLITPLLAVGVAVVVAVEGYRDGWTAAMGIAVGVGLVALGFIPLSVPAALGSLARRYRGWSR